MRKLCRGGLCLLLILALGSPSAIAGSHEDKARELLELTGAKRTMAALLPPVVTAMMNAMRKANPNIPGDMPDIVQQSLQEIWEPLVVPKIMDETVKLYVANLSEADIDAAIVFYRTPGGQHMLQKLPILMQQGMQIGQSAMQSVMPEFQARLILNLKARHPELG